MNTDYIIIGLLVLIWYSNSRYGTKTMNWIEKVLNKTRKALRK